MKRLVLGMSVAVLGVGLAAPAAQAAPADTFVELDTVEYEMHLDETFFGGEIFSDRRKCLLDRKIVVFRKRGGKDEKMGKTEANEDKPNEFGWTVVSPGEAKAGTYYAKAPAIDGCNADKSKSFEYAGAPPVRAAKGDTLLFFTILAYSEGVNEATYFGPIESDKDKCLDGRKVTVFRKRGGPDDKIGTAETAEGQPDNYRWVLVKFQEPKEGTYYAKVAPTDDCAGDKSLPRKYPS